MPGSLLTSGDWVKRERGRYGYAEGVLLAVTKVVTGLGPIEHLFYPEPWTTWSQSDRHVTT